MLLDGILSSEKVKNRYMVFELFEEFYHGLPFMKYEGEGSFNDIFDEATSKLTPSHLTPSQLTPSHLTPSHLTPSQLTLFADQHTDTSEVIREGEIPALRDLNILDVTDMLYNWYLT